MAKYIYNCSGEAKTYHSVEIENESYYAIPAHLDAEYMSNSQLISDLALGIVQMSANGSSPMAGDGSAHVDFLKGVDPSPRDSDGSPLQRVKVTSTGWNYQLHGIEFETSNLDGVLSKDANNVDHGFASMKFYKLEEDVEVEITGEDLNQQFLDANCVKTIIDWEPTHDIEVIGGMLKQTTAPAQDIRLWVIGVPDVPIQYGGSKLFCTSINLRYAGVEEGIKVDGRAPKMLPYSAINHTSKLRLVFRHPAGLKHKMHMIFEFFKA